MLLKETVNATTTTTKIEFWRDKKKKKQKNLAGRGFFSERQMNFSEGFSIRC